jgi:hypothetical protein
MRGFRLNGWQRIGIVLSIVWAIAAWFYARHVDLDLHSNVLNLEYHRCADLPSEKERADCIERARHDFESSFQADWLYVSAVALLPIPIAWLIAYGLVALVRWISRGIT